MAFKISKAGGAQLSVQAKNTSSSPGKSMKVADSSIPKGAHHGLEKMNGMVDAPAIVSSEESAHAEVGINNLKPEIISCFDFLPMYSNNNNLDGHETGRPIRRFGGQRGEDVRKSLSTSTILPTVVAELADLQIQATNLKMEGFKNELAEFISTGAEGTAFQLERFYDTTQQDVAANVIKYYNVMYKAISAIETAQDLKSYYINAASSLSDPMTITAYTQYFIPLEYTVQEYSLRTILSGMSMSDFFRDYLYFDPAIFSTFSNTKVYNQMLQDLSSIIQNATPSLLDNPAEDLSRTADKGSQDAFLVDTNIHKAFSPIRESLERIVQIDTPESFSYELVESGDYTFQDYMDFISSLPVSAVKRISLLSHFVNRDAVLKHNLSIFKENIFTGVYLESGLSFPEDPNEAEFESAGDTTISEIPRFMEGSIKNVLSRAIGSPSGDCFEVMGKTGASKVSILTSTRQSRTGLSSTVLPFESSDNVAPTKSYQSGLSFFTKNISDATSENSGMLDFVSSMVSPFQNFSKGILDLTQSLPVGAHRLLYGNQDGTPTTNLVFFRSLVNELKIYFEERPAYGLDAAQLAILSMADDPDIGYRLARFMMNYKNHLALPVSYSYPTEHGPGPVDETGNIPSSASDPDSNNYRFYASGVLEYISNVGSRDRDLIESMIDLANAVHNKTALLSTEVSVPGYSSTGLMDSDTSYSSFFINTYEKYREQTADGPVNYATVSNSPGSATEGLTSGWGMSLMQALNDPTCLFGKICQAVDNFNDEIYLLAQITEPYTSVKQQSTFQFRGIHQVMIATEMCKEIINEYMPVKIANTGYEVEHQAPYIAPGSPGEDGIFNQHLYTSYFLNRIRIDISTSHIDGLVSAVSNLPTSSGGGMTGGEPPIGGESPMTSEYSDVIKRSIVDIQVNLMNQDVEITNICKVLNNIGSNFNSASDLLTEAALLLVGSISSVPGMGVDVDVTLTDAAARAMFQSIRQDTTNHTLSLLSPEQIQTMSAMYYALSHGGDYSTLFPGGKVLSPADCQITKKILMQSPFLADDSKRRKILTIGLPAKIVEELRLNLSFNAVKEFGSDYFTDQSTTTTAEETFGLGGSAALSKYSLVKVKVYKRNLQRDFSAYKPKTFIFDPGMFILPFQSDKVSQMVGWGDDFLSIASRVVFSKLSIMHEGGSLSLEEGTVPFISGEGALTSYAKEVYPWAFIKTAEGAGEGVTTSGQEASITAVGGKTQATKMIEALITNHLVNYGLRNYLKLASDVDVNEHIFQFQNNGFKSFPDPLTSDLYDGFLDFMSSRQKVGDAESARNIDYLRKLCEISYPFARENYRDRVVNAMSFDRVFNVMIDEDSFEEYQLSDDDTVTNGDSGVKVGAGEVSDSPPGPGSEEPAFVVSFDSEQSIRSFSSTTGLDASYSDYFVTVELYQPVQYAPDESHESGTSSEAETAGEDALDGGLLEEGAEKDIEMMTPIETIPPDSLGEIYTDDPALLESQITDMLEKLQPWTDTKDMTGDIQDMFDRSVVCPKFYGSISTDTEDFLNNNTDVRNEMNSMLDDIMTSAGATDLTATDMISQIQSRAFESMDRTDSFGTENLASSGVGSAADLVSDYLINDSMASEVDSILRGFESQIGSAFSSGIDSIAGVDSSIFDSGLSSGLLGMNGSEAPLASFEAASSLTDTQLSYGMAYESMSSLEGLSSMGSAVSDGVGAAALGESLSMFEFHSSYTSGYQNSMTNNMTGLF